MPACCIDGDFVSTREGKNTGDSVCQFVAMKPYISPAERPAVMDPRVTETICFMQESLAGAISVETLANRVRLSPSRLRRLFGNETSQSPMEYLANLRMQNAERLLKTTFLSIKEIAFNCGSKHVSTFVRQFKKRHGLTPTRFRARNARRNPSIAVGIDARK